MKSTICLLFILFFSFGFAQDCECASDLDFVAAKAKESPSFKSQWKSPLADQFLIAGLKEDMRNDENLALNCLYYLQTYLGAVKDNHIYIADFDKEKDYASLTPSYEGSPEDLSSNAVTTTDVCGRGLENIICKNLRTLQRSRKATARSIVLGEQSYQREIVGRCSADTIAQLYETVSELCQRDANIRAMMDEEEARAYCQEDSEDEFIMKMLNGGSKKLLPCLVSPIIGRPELQYKSGLPMVPRMA